MEAEQEFLVPKQMNGESKSNSTVSSSIDNSLQFLSPEESPNLPALIEGSGGGRGTGVAVISTVLTPSKPLSNSDGGKKGKDGKSLLMAENGCTVRVSGKDSGVDVANLGAGPIVNEQSSSDEPAQEPQIKVRQRNPPKKFTPPVAIKNNTKQPSEYGKKRFRADKEARPLSPSSKEQIDHMMLESPNAAQKQRATTPIPLLEFTVVRNKTDNNTADLKDFVKSGLANLKPAETVGPFIDAAPPELTAADILPLQEKRSAGRPRVPKEVKKGKDRKKSVQLSDKEREFLRSDFRDGAKIRSLSAKYHVSVATAGKIAHETHPPARRGGPTIRKMTPAVSQYLSDTLHQSPTTSTKALVEGIKQKFDMEVDRTTVDKHITSSKMSEHGLEPFSFTKMYTHEEARNTPETKAERKIHIQQYRTLKNSGFDFLFCDESAFALTTYKKRGWSARGERTVVRRRRFRVENVSGIVFASVRFGIVHTVWVIGPVTELVFQAALVDFIKHYQQLNKAQAVLMLDNVKFHCTDAVRDILTKNNYHVLQAARYSPELMPMELVFGIVKARVVIDPSYTTPNQIIPSLIAATNAITVEEFNACVAHVETHMHPRAMTDDDLNLRDSLAGFRAEKKLLGPERVAAVHNPKGSPLLKKYKKAKTGVSAPTSAAAPAPAASDAAPTASLATAGTAALAAVSPSVVPTTENVVISKSLPSASTIATNGVPSAASAISQSIFEQDEEEEEEDEEAEEDVYSDSLEESLPTFAVKRGRDDTPKFKSPVAFNSSADFFQGVYHPPLPNFEKMLKGDGKELGDSSSLNNDCLYYSSLLLALGRHTPPHIILALIPLLRHVLSIFMSRPEVFQELLPFFLQSAVFLRNHIQGVARGGEMGTITELMMISRLFDRPALVHPDNSYRAYRVNEALAARSRYMHVAHLHNVHFVPVWPLDAAPIVGLGAQPLIRLDANNGVLELIE